MSALLGYFTDPYPVIGRVRVLQVPAPSAGAEWTASPAEGRAWRILSGLSSLAAGAGVANRFPGLLVAWGGQNVWQGAVPTAITAGLTVPVAYAPEVTSTSQATANWPAQLEIPPVWLPPDATISSDTPGLQAADQYGATSLLIQEAWPSPHELGRIEQRLQQIAQLAGAGLPIHQTR